MADLVRLKASDGVNIAGDHYKGPAESPGVVLLHMMPSSRKSWEGFARRLNESGFGALAIDLRGHGESDGGPDGYREYTDIEHQKSIEDLKTAVDFQIKEGHSKIFLAGASIGANLALQYLAESDKASVGALLSAGLNYRGIETLPLVKKIGRDKGVFFLASKDDRIEGADKMAQTLYDAADCHKEIKIFDKGGHGTDLFKTHPDLMDEIINWLKKF